MISFMPFAIGILEDQGYRELCSKADRLGLMIGTAGVAAKWNWNSDYAVAGNTFPVKDTLKANGARWNAAAKAWTFASLESLNVAINAIQEN